jgi:predicted aldo/keto reductase-like oxidoreductase
VSTAVPGVKNANELKRTLRFLGATDEEKDFSSVVSHYQEDLKGNCVYCNHCLPCPVGIDIGRKIQTLDKTLATSSDGLKDDYKTHKRKRSFYFPSRIRSTTGELKDQSTRASACTECGVCVERCPFEVDVVSKMKQAAELSEKKT